MQNLQSKQRLVTSSKKSGKLTVSAPNMSNMPPTTSTTPPTSIVPHWETNMDRVIEEVAKGNFQRGESFDYYKKNIATTTASGTIKPKRGARGKTRDELSPKMNLTGMAGINQLHIDPSGMPTMPMPGLLSPIGISMSHHLPSPGLALPIDVQSSTGMPSVSNASQMRVMANIAAPQSYGSSAMASPSSRTPAKPGENTYLLSYFPDRLFGQSLWYMGNPLDHRALYRGFSNSLSLGRWSSIIIHVLVDPI